MIREIITDYDKLSERSEEFNVRKEGKIVRALVVDLKDTIRENNLLCLSAIQVDVARRLFVLNYSGSLRSYVNPMVTKVEDFTLSRETDPCLPNRTFIVPRYNKITINYLTPMGAVESVNLVGKAAYVAQQMCDYLEGVLISDIGMEIEDDFDEATDEEKAQILQMFIESLDVRQKLLETEISEDKDLSRLQDSVTFLSKLNDGSIELGEAVTTEYDFADDDEE